MSINTSPITNFFTSLKSKFISDTDSDPKNTTTTTYPDSYRTEPTPCIEISGGGDKNDAHSVKSEPTSHFSRSSSCPQIVLVQQNIQYNQINNYHASQNQQEEGFYQKIDNQIHYLKIDRNRPAFIKTLPIFYVNHNAEHVIYNISEKKFQVISKSTLLGMDLLLFPMHFTYLQRKLLRATFATLTIGVKFLGL